MLTCDNFAADFCLCWPLSTSRNRQNLASSGLFGEKEPKRQTEGRVHDLKRDKGEGVKNPKKIADVICLWSRRRRRMLHHPSGSSSTWPRTPQQQRTERDDDLFSRAMRDANLSKVRQL